MCMYLSVCVHHVYGQKEASDPLELEFLTVVSHHVDAAKPTQLLLQEQSVLSHLSSLRFHCFPQLYTDCPIVKVTVLHKGFHLDACHHEISYWNISLAKLGMEPRASGVLAETSTTEPHPIPAFAILKSKTKSKRINF